jgi:phosphatidate cytidylyltransferase
VITPNPPTPSERGTAAANNGAARNFSLRVVSAVVLAPIALVSTYVGGWLFVIFCATAAAAILWEWTSLVAAWRGRNSAGSTLLWGAGGVIYAGTTFVSPVLLRRDPVWGLTALLFLFAIVWATDILAYLVGRAVGGPLLWPRVSPNKTWAGAIGGSVGGVAAGTLVAYASGGTNPLMAGVLALILSIVAQSGDLFESGVKRRFGVKDASNLIPGHGGVMDRLDGFLFAATVAVVIGLVRQGLAAPAQGLLIW